MSLLFVAGTVSTLIAGEVDSWGAFAVSAGMAATFAVVALGNFGRLAYGRETFFITEETLVIRMSSPGLSRDREYDRSNIHGARLATLSEAPRANTDSLGVTSKPADYSGGILFELDGTTIRSAEGASKEQAERLVDAIR